MTALIAALAGALMLHGLWRAAGARSPWPRRLLGLTARIVGAQARIIGTPLRRDVVFVSNHLSWIDILLLAGATGTTFVAKGELKAVPLVGWLCTLNNTLFVERGNRMGIRAQIERLRAALASGWAVTIFIEGTTGDGRALLPFKPALLAAIDPPPPGLRVQPVRIDYGPQTEMLVWGDESGPAHAKRILMRRGKFPATLNFSESFAPADHGDRKGVAAEARRRMTQD